MDSRAWHAAVHGVAMSRTRTEQLSNNMEHKFPGFVFQLQLAFMWVLVYYVRIKTAREEHTLGAVGRGGVDAQGDLLSAFAEGVVPHCCQGPGLLSRGPRGRRDKAERLPPGRFLLSHVSLSEIPDSKDGVHPRQQGRMHSVVCVWAG